MPQIRGRRPDCGYQHHILSIDEETERGLCSVCGPVWLRSNGWNHNLDGTRGSRRWRCGNVQRRKGTQKVLPLGLRDTCSRCGFAAEDPCQIDIHHKDGDWQNDAESNFEFLCANCHRLITKRERRRTHERTAGL